MKPTVTRLQAAAAVQTTVTHLQAAAVQTIVPNIQGAVETEAKLEDKPVTHH